jgi:hypothetical protein
MMAAVVVCNLLYLTSGCASRMIVRTTPSDADVTVDGEPVGKSPATWSGKSGLPNKSVMVEAKKEGYKDAEKVVERDDLNAGYLILSILFFVPGILWSWEYPDSVNLTLEPQDQQPQAQGQPQEQPKTGQLNN